MNIRPDLGEQSLLAKGSAAGGNAALSDLHRSLRHLELDTDAHRINRIGNHPSVYPWIKGNAIGRLDLSPVFSEPGSVVLGHGKKAVIYHMITPGVYEGHTMAMPESRGSEMLGFCLASMHWLFTRTAAVEIVARVPQGNVAVGALTKILGFRKEFVAERGWVQSGDPVPATVYSLTLQEWASRAPGLIERGIWFHDKLETELARAGKTEPNHEEDEVHNRFVGMAYEMIAHGQPDKGCLFYDRWAFLANYAPIGIVTREPLLIDIGTAHVLIRDDGSFWCPLVR